MPADTPPPAVPRATYRVQLHAGFTFDDAAAVVPYLARLGISHLYCSPYFAAVPGSTHGYDVVDPALLNPELGGEAGFLRLVAALDAHGMSQVLDVVPNHMATVVPGNRWWWDVLENGPASRYAGHFDIDWDPPERKLRATVLVPVLEDHIGRVLEAGGLRLRRAGGGVEVVYHDHRFPVSPRSLDTVLGAAAERVQSAELATIADSLARLPHAERTEPDAMLRRHRDKEVVRAWLARLCQEDADVAAAIDAELARIEADVSAFDDLLDRQNYRLAYWRVANEEVDYRRFFDIPTLVGVRVEDPRVFADSHALVAELVARGAVEGLRIDHPDGLRDPEEYLRRVHSEIRPRWLVVEKILAPGERLPETWPVDGTTGYDFLNLVLGLFIDPAGESTLTQLYADVTGAEVDIAAVARDAKQEVLAGSLRPDLDRLTQAFAAVTARHPRHRDHTRDDLRGALVALLRELDVYRTYVRSTGGEQVTDADVLRLEAAQAGALAAAGVDAELLGFLVDVLLLRHSGPAEEELALRFQQVSGPVMAKAVEDTAFYRHLRLIALNEVGGDPGRFGVAPDEFHMWNLDVASGGRAPMLTTATHDHKRGEDVRARLALLSEVPDAWSSMVARWSKLAEPYWFGAEPDRAVEYLLFQTAFGAHPLPVDRALPVIEKSIREAKTHTAWVDGDPDYESRVRTFVTGLLNDAEFAASLDDFAAGLEPAWTETVLAQTLLRLTAPGVPDTYQGTELFDLSLVDPDNRRPVDFAARAALLDEIERGGPAAARAAADRGGLKLFCVQRTLDYRRRHPQTFAPGATYAPLAFAGPEADRAVGFVRAGRAAVVVPRLAAGRDGWDGTTARLPDGRWHDEFTGRDWDGGRQELAAVLGGFPVALLHRVG